MQNFVWIPNIRHVCASGESSDVFASSYVNEDRLGVLMVSKWGMYIGHPLSTPNLAWDGCE